MEDKDPQQSNAKPPKKGGPFGFIALALAAMVSSFGWNYFSAEQPIGTDGDCPVAPLAATYIGEPEPTDYSYTSLPEILITIGSTPAERYLKMTLAVATPEDKAKAVKEAEIVLADAFNTYLRSIEIADFENPIFYNQMRDELAWRSELVLGSSVSKGVLITEFLLR
ncbi:MAG: flagellar basal body-associated FliL family protein [Pseudomonadota bacterium]